MAAAKIVPVSEVTGAVNKAGTVVSKPVFGKRETYTALKELRDGQVVEVQVERRVEVPAWMAGLGIFVGGLATLAVAGAAVDARSGGKYSEAYRKRQEERKARRAQEALDRGAAGQSTGNFFADLVLWKPFGR